MSVNLVVQTAFLGDLLLSIPLFKRTRLLWPEQKIFLVCRKGFGEFFKKLDLVDEVFEITKGNAATYERIQAELSRYQIERVISPHESFRTAWLCRPLDAKVKVSFSHWWNEWIFTESITKPQHLPDAIRQLSLLTPFDQELKRLIQDYDETQVPYAKSEKGQLTMPPAWASMSLRDKFLSDTKEWQTTQERLKLAPFSDQTVLIFPGSVWATKRWTEQGFIDATKKIAELAPVYIMGGPGEEELCERVAQAAGVRSLCGQTSVYQSALLMSRSSLVIANDSASGHLAAVAQVPLLSIFGPTVLDFGYRPWTGHAYVMEVEGLPCRPCGKHGHKECPIKTHQCMKDISSEQVINLARQLLSTPSR